MPKLKQEARTVIRRACNLQMAQTALDIVEQMDPILPSDHKRVSKIIKMLITIRGNECKKMDEIAAKL